MSNDELVPKNKNNKNINININDFRNNSKSKFFKLRLIKFVQEENIDDISSTNPVLKLDISKFSNEVQ